MRRFLVLALAVIPVAVAAQRIGGAPVQLPGNVPGRGGPLPADGSSAISGVVLDGATGLPIPGAMVGVNVVGRPLNITQRTMIADAKGRFAFVNLPASPSYTLAVNKPGYVDGGYGRDRTATDPLREIAVRDGEWVQDIRISLWRFSAISGTVRDERGEPVVGVYVRALIRGHVMGRDELIAGPFVTTDDRGVYRMPGLPPARYLIQVPSVQASAPESLPISPTMSSRGLDSALDQDGTSMRLFLSRYPLPPASEDGRQRIYPPAFHPGASSIAQAVTIDLGLGEDRQGVDILLEPVPVVRVSGLIEGPPDSLKNLTVRLIPAGLENLGAGVETATALVNDGGRFTFLNVPPGTYTVDAPRTVSEYRSNLGLVGPGSGPSYPSASVGWSGTNATTDSSSVRFWSTDYRSGAPHYSGRTTVTVGASDITNLLVPLRAHVMLGGWFKLDVDPAKPPLNGFPALAPTVEPANANPSLGLLRSTPDPDGFPEEFAIYGLGPGEYWFRLANPAWIIKSIQWKGHEYVDTPFDASAGTDFNNVAVTITNTGPTISGTVKDADGAKPAASTVLLFPTEHALWTNTGFTPPRFKSVTTPGTGTFRLPPVPAGEYWLVAVPTSQVGAWREVESLVMLERVATRVSLSWGAQTMQDLRLRSMK